MHILAKHPFKKKKTVLSPCHASSTLRGDRVSSCWEEPKKSAPAGQPRNVTGKTWKPVTNAIIHFETILVIYPSICTAQSLGKNGGAHCRCMRCLAVTGTSPRDPILRLNIPILLFNNESLLHVSCSVFVQLSISESYDTSSHKLS